MFGEREKEKRGERACKIGVTQGLQFVWAQTGCGVEAADPRIPSSPGNRGVADYRLDKPCRFIAAIRRDSDLLLCTVCSVLGGRERAAEQTLLY